MLGKIVFSTIMATGLLLLVFMFVKFIKETIKHRKRMRKLNEWSNFHKQLKDWSKEISDQNIRYKYMNECINRLANHSDRIDIIDDFSIEEEREEVYRKWGKYIPSLQEEIREIRLNKIL